MAPRKIVPPLEKGIGPCPTWVFRTISDNIFFYPGFSSSQDGQWQTIWTQGFKETICTVSYMYRKLYVESPNTRKEINGNKEKNFTYFSADDQKILPKLLFQIGQGRYVWFRQVCGCSGDDNHVVASAVDPFLMATHSYSREVKSWLDLDTTSHSLPSKHQDLPNFSLLIRMLN